jgi:hypothetical protein
MGSLAAAPSLCQSRRSSFGLSFLFSIVLVVFLKRKLANSPVINTVRGQALFRSYGRLFAEFLDEESLVHLGLLDLSTCVGLRYG